MKARILAPENRKWLTLVALCFALFMIMLDNTVVNVALPSIKRDLGLGVSELEWIVNAYVLVFAVLMLSGGKLADLLGRRRIFLIGLAIFTLSSLACGLAGSAGLLIEANKYGWTSATILSLFGVAAAAVVAFVLLELHQRIPMMDLTLFRDGTFAGANTVALLVGLAMFGVFFFVSLYMQNILRYSPVRAGA